MIDGFYRIYYPYCIKMISERKIVVLNRNYKPLGYTSRLYVDYNDYAVPIKMTKTLIEKISVHFQEYKECLPILTKRRDRLLKSHNDYLARGFVFLYDDCTNPAKSKKHMDVYLKKLGFLALAKPLTKSHL